MTVLAPTANAQIRKFGLWYLPGLAGSGFVGEGTVMPNNVLFFAHRGREGRVTAVATGYYDVVLRQNGAVHEQGDWINPTATNDIGADQVGTHPPGTRKPSVKA